MEKLSQDRFFFSNPERVLFGCNSRVDLPPLLGKIGYRSALIVTDRFFTNSTTIVSDLLTQLDQCGITAHVFDGGLPDPSVELCVAATSWVAQQPNASAIDHIIAIGGGSNIDLAKVISITVRFGGHPASYVGEGRLPAKPLPLVAIPTTSGAGSEVTPGAILVSDNSSTKVALMDNDLRPEIVVIDPELTLSCPPKVTADAGIDALTHAIESYLTCDSSAFPRGQGTDPGYSGRNLLTKTLAGKAIRLLFQHLPTVYRDGSNLEARTGMAYGSFLAALSYGSAGLNAVHALAYALASLTHASHGRTNAVLLPYVMDNLLEVRLEDLARIGRLAGCTDSNTRTRAREAVRITRELVQSLDIPITLNEFGVSRNQLEEIVNAGLKIDRLTKAYPIQPAEVAYRQIVQNAYDGTLHDCA